MKNNLRYQAYSILYEVLFKGGYSNLLLQNRIENFNQKDKALITNLVYGTLQNYDLLKFQLNQIQYEKMNNKILTLVVLSLYQKHFLDKIPNYAIVDQAIEISKKILNKYQANFISAILHELINKELVYAQSNDEDLDLAINYSHPLWLVKMIKKQYGKDILIKYLEENNKPATLNLRYNIVSNKLNEINSNPNLKYASFTKTGYYYLKDDIAKFEPYLKGYVSVQDFSSQEVAYFLNPQKDSKVLDMCAAPGTKTSHLAELMENTGEIKAYDIYEHKIPLIEKQANRLGLTNIKANSYDSTKLLEIEEKESFDYILCDAPCTGLGVIKRKPEIKYHDIANSMDEIILIQEKLLDVAYSLLKKGGVLVYSTCTINKKENEKQIEKLLNSHSDLELVEDKTIFNFEHGADCFYLAKVIKN